MIGASVAVLPTRRRATLDAFVDVEATGRAGAIRVVAGDPDASYLVAKCTEAGDAEGEPMPAEGGLDEERLALLRGWIAAGAEP